MDILIEQEIELHQYHVRTSKADLERLLHHSFTEVGQSGTSFDYDAIIAMMTCERSSKGYIHSQNYECVPLEQAVQLLKYQSAFISETGAISHYTKRCSIWAFTGFNWQLKYHQATPCPTFEIQKMS